jgi:hypothetical protein
MHEENCQQFQYKVTDEMITNTVLAFCSEGLVGIEVVVYIYIFIIGWMGVAHFERVYILIIIACTANYHRKTACLKAHTDRTRFGNANFQFWMTFNFNMFQCFSNIRNHLSNFSYLVCISCKNFIRRRFYLLLKTENSRRVAESRSVCACGPLV